MQNDAQGQCIPHHLHSYSTQTLHVLIEHARFLSSTLHEVDRCCMTTNCGIAKQVLECLLSTCFTSCPTSLLTQRLTTVMC
jgi:hypothetical protein